MCQPMYPFFLMEDSVLLLCPNAGVVFYEYWEGSKTGIAGVRERTEKSMAAKGLLPLTPSMAMGSSKNEDYVQSVKDS